MTRVSRRVGEITESATLAVDARAKALRAEGEDVIGFGAGEPDFPTPDHIVAAAAEACRDPRNHHYTPTAGLPELRAAIAEKTRRDSGVVCEPSQVLVTNGAKHAVYEVLQTLVDPGDEVLLPAPYWTTYPEVISLAGGEPVVVPTSEATEFRVTVKQLEAARTPRTKALFFVSPSNPSGAVYPPSEVDAIGRWAVETGVWVLCDEIYEHLTYGDHRFTSMPGRVPDLAGTSFIINGVAKTFAMTGWRVGWIVGPPDVIKAAVNLQSHSTSNVANVSQRAAIAALNGDLEAVATMRTAYARRGTRMQQLLSAIPGVTCLAPQGAFYCFPSFAGVLGREIAGRHCNTSLDLAAALLDEAKVAVVPGEAFGAPGYARLSFAASDEAIEEGVERIAKLLT
jgi:aspartate/methionine/tyrosine aminotransferase